jgi:predicted aldo/keto reductase-like oxidoreductase
LTAARPSLFSSQVFAAGDVKREDVILQTKAGARGTPEAMRACLEDSFKRLQVDTVWGGYIDFFSFHGINREHQVVSNQARVQSSGQGEERGLARLCT